MVDERANIVLQNKDVASESTNCFALSLDGECETFTVTADPSDLTCRHAGH
jgi:hypothetical protein